MKLSEYILLSREVRTAHTDLRTPCVLKGNGGASRERGRKALLALLGVENDCPNWVEGKIQVCHLCDHNSSNGYCENPNHLYFGTPSENKLDTTQEVRQAAGRKAGKVSTEKHRENRTGFFDPAFHDPKRKPVVLTRLSDGEETWFPSLTAAAEAVQSNTGCLSRVLNGKLKTHRGHTARFAN